MIPSLGPSEVGRWCLDTILGLVYPNCCQICGAEDASARDGYVGSRCRGSLRFIGDARCERCGLPFPGDLTQSFACANCDGVELEFESARAAVVATGVALEVIHRFKYQRALWFEPFLSGLLLDAALPHLTGAGWTAVVPVPLHPFKQRLREFNQAERLAAPLARALQLPLLSRCVRRREATPTQTHLTRSQRAENVRRAFQSIGDARLDDLSVIVVDDVLTTGATASALAGVLLALGASRVCIWSVARAVLGEPPTL